MDKTEKNWKNQLINLLDKDNILFENEEIRPYVTGIRVGEGKAQAVVHPKNLLEMWEILKIAVKSNLIIIMQAANTGLTGGSTPDGANYNREIIIINTLYTFKEYSTNIKIIIYFWWWWW